MASLSSTKVLSLTLLALAVALLTSGHLGVTAQSSHNCNANIQNLLAHCAKYVQKEGSRVSPSAQCCAAIKPVDLHCACNVVTRDVEGVISMEKAVYVARSCGIRVSPGLKCGSYTVPPP